eukprot:2067968-Amphidinium_carterae.1
MSTYALDALRELRLVSIFHDDSRIMSVRSGMSRRRFLDSDRQIGLHLHFIKKIKLIGPSGSCLIFTSP